jgi:hypothetical protein
MKNQEENPNYEKLNSAKSFLKGIPFTVYIVAIFAGLLSIAPYWRAQFQTPPGWTFSGNVSVSPDNMQYRVWMRQSQHTGVLVANTLTSEPNKPHLFLPFYYLLGRIATILHVQPEFVYAYAGSFLAFLFTVLLFATIRLFFMSMYQVWWVFFVVLIGGGLGAHLRFLSILSFARNNFLIQRTLIEGLRAWPTFEDYRANYVFFTLFDTHFLLVWLVTTASIVSFYFTLKRYSLIRLLVCIALFAATTMLHIYEGITLLFITTAIIFLLYRKKIANRSMYFTYIACCVTIVISLFILLLLYKLGGLSPSDWRGVNILVTTLLISYPIAWLLIFLGFIKYWQKASFNEIFLVGWALGCCILTLSGPFYPYPNRGIMTFQIPLYIIAGAIYFMYFKKVSWQASLLVILVLGATPLWFLKQRWDNTTFVTNSPVEFLSAENLEIIDALKNNATKDDILITDMSKPEWQGDQLWLAPEYPGKLYCGHFFLTVDFDRKRSELTHFYQTTTPVEEQVAFLQKNNIRFMYVDSNEDPQRFQRIPGIILLKSTSIGSLFEYHTSG